MSAILVKTDQPIAAPAATSVDDQRWSGLYRLGGYLLGLAGIASVAAYYMSSHLYSSGIPTTPTAYLQLVAHNQVLASSTWSLWIVLDLLLIAPTGRALSRLAARQLHPGAAGLAPLHAVHLL